MTTEPNEQEAVAVEVDPQKIPQIEGGVVVQQEGSNTRVVVGGQDGSDE